MSNNDQKSTSRCLLSIFQPIWVGVLLILLFSNSLSASNLFDLNFDIGGNQMFTFNQTADVAVAPTISIEAALDDTEGNSGTKQLTFEVFLSVAADQTVSVDFATADGTAIAGQDYVAVSGTLIFAPGERSKTISVTIIGDAVIEPIETFTVNLSNAVNATIFRSIGSAFIINDDSGGSLQFSVTDYTVNENAGTATITVTRTNGAASGVAVNYSTANGTATAGQDYTPVSGTLNFGAGETVKTFTIPITDDTIIEPNETINLTLSNPVGGANFGTSSLGVLIILDDEGAPTLSINNVTRFEGQSGTTAFNFTVSLSGMMTTQTVTVNYATADGTATSPSRYQATSGSLYFAPGETAKTITVLVNGERFIDNIRTFTVNLSNAVNATIANAQGMGTILNDDFDSSIPCSYVVSPTNINLGAEASTGNTISILIQGTPNNRCGVFEAGANSSFITITSRIYGSNLGFEIGRVVFSVAANTGDARTGTLSIARAGITVNQAAGHKVLFDFDGDGKSDISVFRPSNGFWYISKNSGGYSFVQWGLATDTPVPGDYDGDGKTDLAVYRRNGNRDGSIWYILRSSDNTFTARPLGSSGFLGDDLPTPADYDGDGKTDLAVYTGSDAIGSPSNFIIIQSSTNSVVSKQWGLNTDKRVVADYDGDGKDDLAVYRYRTLNQVAEVGTWYIQQSTNGATRIEYFGLPSDTLVPGDYDGDGKADIAVWRPSNGYWYWISSRDKSFNSYQFGQSDDKPVPADYDGDGKIGFAVFRPSNGVWYLQQSNKGFRAEQFGLSTDVPIPNVFVR